MTSHGQNQSRQPDDARNVHPKADVGASSKSISHGGGKSRGFGGGVANSANAANAAAEVVWFPKAERYKRLSEPISGGMGVVFKALDTNLDIEVAIKRIRPEFAANAELIKRFEREARTQVRLKHQNLVQVRDYAIDEIGPYIVMDWIEGQSLAQLVKDGPIEWKKAARIVGKCAMALHVAHEAGIIHRDIKPANILLNASGEPFVTDFGLVRIEAEHSATGETVTGVLLGTVDFMAPEQLEDPRKASIQSDIWSLGATLYRITTGRSVRGMRESLIPEQVREIVIEAMEENPNERYKCMQEFAKSLKAAITTSSRRDVLEKPSRSNVIGGETIVGYANLPSNERSRAIEERARSTTSNSSTLPLDEKLQASRPSVWGSRLHACGQAGLLLLGIIYFSVGFEYWGRTPYTSPNEAEWCESLSLIESLNTALDSVVSGYRQQLPIVDKTPIYQFFDTQQRKEVAFIKSLDAHGFSSSKKLFSTGGAGSLREL